MDSNRYEKGLEMLSRIDGRAGEEVAESLAKISPDLARYMIEYPFGEIYHRPGLDLKSRELVTIAALAALGNARPQLKVHIHGALNVGLTRQEIIEAFIQLSVYSGFPTALNAVFAAAEVFEERGATPDEISSVNERKPENSWSSQGPLSKLRHN